MARDLLQKIKVLNIIRCVLDKKPLYQYSESSYKNVDIFIGVIALFICRQFQFKYCFNLQAIQSSWKYFSHYDKMLLKNFLMELIISGNVPDLLPKLQATEDLSFLFDKLELDYIQMKDRPLETPESLVKTEITFDFVKKRKFHYLYFTV